MYFKGTGYRGYFNADCSVMVRYESITLFLHRTILPLTGVRI